MECFPYNRRLHAILTLKGFWYTQKVRYDRYDNDEGITVFFYPNGYIMILDPNGEPVSSRVAQQITKELT